MRTYAAYIKDSDLLYHSSSGGMFLAASMAILSQGGYIVASNMRWIRKVFNIKYIQNLKM